VQPCDCTRRDLYCEYGYEKNADRQSECHTMVVGSTPKCMAIEDEAYQMSTTHLRLPHNAACPNVADLITDTDGNVCVSSLPVPALALSATSLVIIQSE
jgi:hypothetical protein